METYLVVFASPVWMPYERKLLARLAHLAHEGAGLPTIAVDGGYARCVDAGLVPDCVVGDFDSLGYVPAGADVRVFPCRKDATDGELAMEEAAARGARCVVAVGAFGGRLDHQLANAALFARWAQRGVAVVAVGGEAAAAGESECAAGGESECAVFFIAGPAQLDLPACAEGTVSVVPVGGDARGITIAGLEYLLRDEDLPYGTTRGVSNEFAGGPACVTVREGAVAVVVSALRFLSLLFAPSQGGGRGFEIKSGNRLEFEFK